VERGKDLQVRQVAVPNDTVQLSSDQTTVRGLLSQLGQTPDVRDGRVQSLRLEIQSGKFQRSSDQVARALVDELLSSRPGR
jgi:flagellar biosynthesis anti-sigma factor FlgM